LAYLDFPAHPTSAASDREGVADWPGSFVRNAQIEPFRAVNFREGLKTPASRGPLHFERVAGDGADIDFALDDKGMNAFAATLTDLT
jgi:hypothetical protein